MAVLSRIRSVRRRQEDGVRAHPERSITGLSLTLVLALILTLMHILTPTLTQTRQATAVVEEPRIKRVKRQKKEGVNKTAGGLQKEVGRKNNPGKAGSVSVMYTQRQVDSQLKAEARRVESQVPILTLTINNCNHRGIPNPNPKQVTTQIEAKLSAKLEEQAEEFKNQLKKLEAKQVAATGDLNTHVEDLGDIKQMTCAELKKELTKAGLDTDGKKADLVARLYEARTKADPTKDDGGVKSDDKKVEVLGGDRKAELAPVLEALQDSSLPSS